MEITLIHIFIWFIPLLLMPAESARILGLIPVPSYSHQVGARALWKALAQRGHEVIVVTTNPERTNVANLTEIDYSQGYKHMQMIDFGQERFTSTWLELQTASVVLMSEAFTTDIYELPELRKMYAPGSGQKFDVVIAENVVTPGCFALAHRFQAPLIGIASLDAQLFNHYLLGSPIMPNHLSSWEMEYKVHPNLTFWERLDNFVTMWRHIYYILNHFYPAQQKIAEKYLGKDIPDIADIQRNMSLFLVNQDFTIGYAKPILPITVEFSGSHIDTKVTPLSKELQSYLDSATNGFIYISLGTNVKFSSFPATVKSIFREVLSELPYKILWKADDEDLGKGLDNVRVMKWLPQQSVLAHPNIKLFVYQGGHQSTQEAVHYAVPLIGIPMLADQDYEVNRMVSLEVAKRIDISHITKDLLSSSIREVLDNKKYKENMLRLSNLARDKPYNMTENAVWWIEYVIRHKGAKHLRCSIAFDPWYKKYDTDIIAFLSVAAFVAVVSAVSIILSVLKCLLTHRLKSAGQSKKKIN